MLELVFLTVEEDVAEGVADLLGDVRTLPSKRLRKKRPRRAKRWLRVRAMREAMRWMPRERLVVSLLGDEVEVRLDGVVVRRKPLRFSSAKMASMRRWVGRRRSEEAGDAPEGDVDGGGFGDLGPLEVRDVAALVARIRLRPAPCR
ncbi:MAG: hypothetical protein R3B72_26430 [Polyangiaceae bacterium]